MKIKVGVLFGGETVEHEVSIITAVQAMGFMDEEKYEIVPIYISKDRTWYTGKMLLEMDVYKDFDNLKKYAKRVTLVKKEGSYFLQNTYGLFRRDIAEIDVAFPIVHGYNAEDGTLQGFLDTIGIPYVGCNVLGSAIGQDKVVMKQVMSQEGLPVVPYTWFYDNEYWNAPEACMQKIRQLGFPVVVKPASLGSSVGITIVKEEDKLEEAIREAIRYDSKIVVEQMVKDVVEINCAILGNYEYQEASLLDEIIPYHEFLTFDDKYIGNGKVKGAKSSKGMASADRIIPAPISKEFTEEIQELCKKAFRVCNLSGVTRFDLFVNKKNNKVYINEPNTIPGCLAFYLFSPMGKDYSKLLDDLITLAIKSYKNRKKKITSFDSNILSNFHGAKGAKGLKGAKASFNNKRN